EGCQAASTGRSNERLWLNRLLERRIGSVQTVSFPQGWEHPGPSSGHDHGANAAKNSRSDRADKTRGHAGFELAQIN
ncbi:MAG: hypothetical protein KBF27_12985, partial [Cypionkella sp.]|nr:hypothetical protein [Cypionkella sp.]